MCNIRRQRHFAKLIQDFLITGRDIPDQSYADSLCETLYTKMYDHAWRCASVRMRYGSFLGVRWRSKLVQNSLPGKSLLTAA